MITENILDVLSPQELAKYEDKIVHDLKKEISDAKADGIDTVIFSSEHLHSRLRTRAELERLHNILKDMGFDQIIVLIYLREQASCASSLYGTKILFDGSTNPSPNPKEDNYWDNICDHKKSLLRISNIFGKDSVIPRLFIKESLVEHYIIMDFLHTSCIDLPREIFKFPLRTNESISALGLEVLRAFNKRQPMYLEDGSLNKTRATVPQLFLACFKDGNKFQISTELAQNYHSFYKASNEWVRQEYFPERETLFSTATRSSTTNINLEQHEIDQFADLLNALVMDMGNRCNHSGRDLLSMLFLRVKKRLIHQRQNEKITKGSP